ncbi:hypothetical protein [Fluviicola sp.]|uniref:hypothetical protein n=1 Tax=Fluviicola sp. TaxID=1917219 RepID=UPI00281DFEA7|nr:hypothetical protein [Fluviicola sp.]MDR0802846.1 hypothetical protein [Fluviicola sp.]
MKQIQFVVFLAILSVLTTSCSTKNETDPSDNIPQMITISGNQQHDTVFLHFNFRQKTIRAQRTGKLERLIEKPEFTKNSLLVQFDNYDAFVALNGEKESLKEELLGKINLFSQALQPVEKKWQDFASKLRPDKVLPAIPTYQYKEEAEFLEGINLTERYNNLLEKEAEIKNYFQLSTENGFLTETFAKSGDYVKKNQSLIKYHPKEISATADASFKLTKNIQNQLKTHFIVRLPCDSLRVLKYSSGEIQYLLNLNQKINPKMVPRYFIVNQDQYAFIIPEKYIGKDKKVTIETDKGTEQKTASLRNKEYVLFSMEKALIIRRP